MRDVRITSFRTDSRRIDFTVHGRPYHTNEFGEGIWSGTDYEERIAGICDIQLVQKTRSGVLRAIRKYFGIE